MQNQNYMGIARVIKNVVLFSKLLVLYFGFVKRIVCHFKFALNLLRI